MDYHLKVNLEIVVGYRKVYFARARSSRGSSSRAGAPPGKTPVREAGATLESIPPPLQNIPLDSAGFPKSF